MRTTPETIRLVGGALCLDFVNTTEWAGPGLLLSAELDVLDDADKPVRWGRRLGVLSPDAPVGAGEAELAAVRELRQAVHAIFAALAAGEEPPAAALEQLHAVYAEAVTQALILRSERAWPLTWSATDPRSVRFAVAASAIALLADPAELNRIRQCPGRNCGGLFIDRSGRRRWCSMEVCGSREKMRQLYRRQREAAKSDPGRRPAAGG